MTWKVYSIVYAASGITCSLTSQHSLNNSAGNRETTVTAPLLEVAVTVPTVASLLIDRTFVYELLETTTLGFAPVNRSLSVFRTPPDIPLITTYTAVSAVEEDVTDIV